MRAGSLIAATPSLVAVLLCGCLDRERLDRLWTHPEEQVSREARKKMIEEKAEKEAKKSGKKMNPKAMRKKMVQKLSVKTLGFDPLQHANAAAMYKGKPQKKEAGPEVKKLVAEVDAALARGLALEDHAIWRPLRGLNPYRLLPEVQTARRRWAELVAKDLGGKRTAGKLPGLDERRRSVKPGFPYIYGYSNKERIAFNRVLLDNIDDVERCHKKHRALSARFGSRIVSIRVSVNRAGRVTRSVLGRSSTSNRAAGDCIAAAVRAWRFPKQRRAREARLPFYLGGSYVLRPPRQYGVYKVNVHHLPGAAVEMLAHEIKGKLAARPMEYLGDKLSRCVKTRYRNTLRRDDSLTGKITPCASVGKFGSPKAVTFKQDAIGDPGLASKVKGCMMMLSFPPHAGGTVTVCMPMVLKRRGGKGQTRLHAISLSAGLLKVNRQYRNRHLAVASRGYRRLLEYYPAHPDPRNNLALAELHMGQDLTAWMELEVLRRLHPKYAPASINLTVIKERSRASKEAAALAAGLAAAHPKLPQAAFNAAWYSNVAGDQKAAARLLEPFAKLDLPGDRHIRRFIALNTKQTKAAPAAAGKEEAAGGEDGGSAGGYLAAWGKALLMTGLAGVWDLRNEHKVGTVVAFVICWLVIFTVVSMVAAYSLELGKVRRLLFVGAAHSTFYLLVWGLISGWSWLWIVPMVGAGYSFTGSLEDEQ